VAQQQSVTATKHETKTETKRFGKYLRKIREERRMSLDAVEEMSLGLPERVTKSHLSRIENGQAVPSFPRMFTLSQIYGVPVSSMAERFELCLKAGMVPTQAIRMSKDEILDEAKKLRRGGRHIEALLLYESLLGRNSGLGDLESLQFAIEIRLHCVNCLVQLSRHATAKEECEKLLSLAELTQRQKVVTLQYFAMCCYKLSKFTVAIMIVDKAEQELKKLEDGDRLTATLAVLKGNLCFNLRQYAEASDAYRRAVEKFAQSDDRFESCRTKLNLASTLIELKQHAEARSLLKSVLVIAEKAGYERQVAFALSHLAFLAFRENDKETAEALCLRSNRLARPREYVSILFRNCFYLWRIAKERHDEAGARTNERTLRTYLNRIDDHVPEAEEFAVFLGGGKHE
jgi:tetratricopeptide (TPR) repeat protein